MQNGGSNVELTYRDEQASGIAVANRERALSSNVIPGRDNRMAVTRITADTRINEGDLTREDSCRQGRRNGGRREGARKGQIYRREKKASNTALAEFAC